MNTHFSHVPVMLCECVDGLNINPHGIYVDATLGGGGHSEAILQKLSAHGRLIGIDRDKTAICAASERLSLFGDMFLPAHGNFRDVKKILESLNIAKVNGILFDFGVSSPQIDCPQRGFSYLSDAPLDMRMDQGQQLTAYEVVNSWEFEKLKRIFYEYGEERYAALVAGKIVKYREAKPIDTTRCLAEIILGALPEKTKRLDQHPEKRVFQAIRIAVNDELNSISDALSDSYGLLAPGGRLCAISFHSLEDRIVKNSFSALARGCVCPPDFPVCVCNGKPQIKILTKKPITATEHEQQLNSRSKSAKLRIAEKI